MSPGPSPKVIRGLLLHCGASDRLGRPLSQYSLSCSAGRIYEAICLYANRAVVAVGQQDIQANTREVTRSLQAWGFLLI